MTMRRRRDEGVPSLRNDDVTGLTEPKQDEIVRESGTTPDRGEAAAEFLDEQEDQARDTSRSGDRTESPRAPSEPERRGSHPGLVDRDEGTELGKHWDPGSAGKRK